MVPDPGRNHPVAAPSSIWHSPPEAQRVGRRGADATKMVLGEAAVGWQQVAKSCALEVPCSRVVTLRLFDDAMPTALRVASRGS